MIVIERAPALLTVQDLGWRQQLAMGLPRSGAMDRWALRLGNAIVGNADDAAALEWALGSGKLRFTRPCIFSLTGASLTAFLDGVPVPPYHAIAAAAGAHLRVDGVSLGRFAYVAVHGGIDVPPVLGSRSTYLPTAIGGVQGRPLRTGDLVPLGHDHSPPSRGAGFALPDELRPAYSDVVRVVRGPPDTALEHDVAGLTTHTFTVRGESDRMGYRLGGATLAHRAQSRPSEGACVGAVQLPESGQPIVLMADGPTVGGYAKIAVVISADLPILAQRSERSSVRFHEVSVERAQQAYRRREVDIHTARELVRRTFPAA